MFGGGEGVKDLADIVRTDNTEMTYIAADSYMFFDSNCNTVANRVGFGLSTSGNLYPTVADTATNNSGQIGTSSYAWNYGYFNNLVATTGVTIGGNTALHAGNYTGYTYSSTASRTANTVLAAPDGSAGAASFRHLVSADIYTHSSTDSISNDNTEILTSYISADGFLNATYGSRIYRRPVSAMWGYIKGKAQSSYASIQAGNDTTIASNSDLNDIVSAGNYKVTGADVAATLSNCPYTSSNFRLWHIEGSSSNYGAQVILGGTTARLFIRAKTNNTPTFGSWKEFAFLTSNVASATKLQTARTLWGQSFDGSANVSGDMTDVGSVTMSGNLTATRTTTTATYLRAANSNGSIELHTATNRGLYDRTNTTWVIGTNGTDTWASQGNFGIGTTSPSYKLHVNGTAYATSLYLARSTFYMTSNSNSALVLYHNGDAGLVAGIADIHPASTNSGMTLGTSTYPWDRLYCTAATLTGNVSIGGTLGVTGAATLSSTLGVTGATTLSSTLGVTGNTTLGGDLYLGNAKYIRGKNQSDTYENLLGINSSNNLLIGYGHATSGITCVYGTNLYFKTNGTTNRLTIDSSGNAAFTGNVATSGYLDIGSARLIYDSTNNALKVIGTGGGVMNIYATGGVSALGMAGGADGTMSVALVPDTTNTYNLGASSYRWNYLYARYVNASGASTFSGNVRAASISVNAAANSSYKLYVNGEAYTTGSWGSSDERLKDIIGNPQVELSDIADAPIIEFTWKDKSAGDKPRLGSVAQYWRGVLPMAVKSDKGGWLSMQYGEVALACVVEVAKRTLSHEDRIKALEQENEELRQRIKTLEEAA